jgi:MFS family permease
MLGSFLFAASAPSPLYSIYQSMWGFGPSTLTLIYAIYAFGALAALLFTGRLSDHLGRRAAVSLGLVIQIVSMLAFIFATSIAWLFAARTMQGIATGLATGAISAWMLDLQPPERPRLASVVTGIAILTGLGLGALISSFLVDYAPDPLHLAYWLLLIVFGVALLVLPFIPDLVARVPGWLGSLRPEIAVPPPARTAFALVIPSLVAVWAVAGLYLSLAPSLAIALLKMESRVPGGLVIAGLLGGAALASFVVRAASPRTLLVWGSLIVIAGVALTLLALVSKSALALYGGAVVAGLGFGPAFSGALGTVAPLAPPDRRGALLAAFYIVIYLGFSAPTIAAGFVIPYLGLLNAAVWYAVIVIGLAALTTVAFIWRA